MLESLAFMLRISLQRFAQRDKEQVGFGGFSSVTRPDPAFLCAIQLLKILNLLADLLQFGFTADDTL